MTRSDQLLFFFNLIPTSNYIFFLSISVRRYIRIFEKIPPIHRDVTSQGGMRKKNFYKGNMQFRNFVVPNKKG